MPLTRILFVNHVSQMSGGEQGLINTIARLDKSEFHVLVALPSAGPLSEKLTAAGADVSVIDICRLTKTWNPFLLARYAFSWIRGVGQLSRIIKASSIDLVHANSDTAQMYAGPAAALSGVPCIWQSRDLVNLGPLARWMSNRATAVIAISQSVAAHLEDSGVQKSKISTIHNVVDTDVFSPAATHNEIPIVAMIGQLVPWKKHDCFINCAELILKAVPNVTFEIVGGDLFCEHSLYAKELKDRAKRELPGKIRFTGYCSDMASKLKSIDLVLHPASREPFGRTIIEAMAMAKPVIAVDACGPAEIISHRKDGILVPAGDIEAMASWAVDLLTDADLASKIGEEARKKVETHFSAASAPEELLSLYRDLVSSLAS